MKCKIKLKKSWSFLEKVKDKETFLFKHFLNFTFFFSQNLNTNKKYIFMLRVKTYSICALISIFIFIFIFHILKIIVFDNPREDNRQ